MTFDLNEAITYYQKAGAPGDQMALLNLLKEVQANRGGGIRPSDVKTIAESYQIKESFLLAIIKRYPSLKLENIHTLTICNGVNCSRKAQLLNYVKQKYGHLDNLEIKTINCFHACPKGPNIELDQQMYNHVDYQLIDELIKKL